MIRGEKTEGKHYTSFLIAGRISGRKCLTCMSKCSETEGVSPGTAEIYAIKK